MKTTNIIWTVLVSIIILLSGFVSVQYLSLKRSEVKNAAVDGCLQYSGISEITSDTGKFTYPLKDIYTACMADKGYPTLWK